MREVNLAGVDLNLLVALEALLEERGVTRAAARVGLSQPAMSRALGRLRDLFGDRLLVRTPAGLLPTPRAEALAEPLARALAELRSLLGPDGFDPATARGAVRIVTPDYGSLILLPSLLRRLSREAPGLDVEVLPMGTGADDGLREGRADLAIGRIARAGAGIYRQTLFEDGFACVLRAGHPAAGRLDLETYLGLAHAFITITGQGRGVVDGMLAERGLARRVALRIPHFVAASLVVSETDLVLTLPRRAAERLAADARLVVLDAPLPLGGFEVVQAWHERRQDDPAHAWIRRQVLAAAREAAPQRAGAPIP